MKSDENVGSTYLEEFILSLDILPNNFRRESELMKELDREVCELNKEITTLEESYLSNLKEIRELEAKDQAMQLEQVNGKIQSDIQTIHERISSKMAEKSAIIANLIVIVDQYSMKLDNDLISFEQELKGSGEYEAPRGFPPETEVAFTVSSDSSGERNYILGKVSNYRPELNVYEIIDVDDQQTYTVSETQVVGLNIADSQRRLSKGDQIFALYPDTTIFYPAVVIQAPRRSALNAEAVVIVQFAGDEDISGVVPNRTVQLKYIIRPNL